MDRADFEQFKGDLTEDDLSNLLKIAKKKRTFWLICWVGTLAVYFVLATLIGFLPMNDVTLTISQVLSWIAIAFMVVFAGLGAYTHNVCCYVASRGSKNGGGILSIIWAFIGGVVIGGLVAYICNRTFPISVLGWKKTGVKFTNRKW